MPKRFVRSGLCPILLALAAAVPGSAQPSVSGTVLAAPDRPLAGARIELLPVLDNFAAGRLRLAGGLDPAPVAEGLSDAAGRYVVQAPAAGVFRVVVRGPGRVPMHHPRVLLAEPQELPPVLLAVDAGAHLRVADASGRPIAGAWLFAAGAAESEVEGRVGDGWRTSFRIGRTGADGSLSLPRRSGERLEVSAFPPGGAEEARHAIEGGTILVPAAAATSRSLRVVTPRDEPLADVLVRAGTLSWPVGLTDAEGRLRIPLRPGEPAKLRLVAQDGRRQVVDLPAAGGAETAVVLADPRLVAGRVVDQASSRPLAGALVAIGVDPGTFVLTDATGGYRLVAPDREGFQLEALAPGHLPGTAAVAKAHLLAGRTPALALAPAAVVRGLAVDAQGAPLPGVLLTAVPETGPGLPETVTDRASSDATGAFALRRMRGGRGYELRAQRPGYLPAVTQAVAPEPSRPAPPLKVVLTFARAARGRVQDAEGRPVDAAEVILTPSAEPGRPARPATDAPAPEPLRTDKEGRFTVPQIPANPLDLAVRKPGYAPARVRSLRVPAGSADAGAADLGVVVLRPGARLTGRVTDRAGRPIPGAEVFQVEDLQRIDAKSAWLDPDEVDAVAAPDGSFALEDLAVQAPVNLLVRARGYLPAGLRGVRPPNREPLRVRLAAAAALRGRVIDEERQPVAGARVELTARTDRPVLRFAVAGRDGSFEIVDAPPGAGTLSVEARGYVPIEELPVTLPRPEPDAELVLTLERGALLSGRVSLTDGTPVSGAQIAAAGSGALSDAEGAYLVEGVAIGPATVRVSHPHYRRVARELVIEPGVNQLDVTFEPGVEVAGRVADEQGEPVPGARVELASEARGDVAYRARAAADGSFRLSPVAQGRYRLRASQDGFTSAELQRPVVVAAEPVDGLEIALRRGGAIVGRVLGLEPEELAQVAVAAERAGRSVPAAVDSTGRYEIRRVEPGDYLVRASLGAGQRQVQARVPLAPGQEEVTRDLVFSRRLSLSGVVLYDEEPLADAPLVVRGSRFAVERAVVTDYRGAFRFDDLEPDVYALGVSHPREPLVHNETVEVTADRDVTIRLRAVVVRGTVVDAKSGGPVPGALLLLRHVAGAEGPEFLISGGSDPDGGFVLSHVPPGSYRLTVSANGFAPDEREIAVAGQEVAGLEIALKSTAGLDVTVRLASGKVPELVHVRVLAPSGLPVVAETRVPERSGALRLPTIPPGDWNLLLSATGGAVTSSRASVPGEPIAVTLPAAGRLHVRVPALASSDLVAAVTVRGADHQPFWALGLGGALQDQWPLIAGSAVVDGLPAGLWLVRVDAPDGRTWAGTATTTGKADAAVALE